MALATESTQPVPVGSPRAPAVATVGAPVGFTPLSLPGLGLWLDAGQIGGLADGDPVGTWPDLSGLGNHATQATVAKKPLLKLGIVNGRAVVRLDPVDDFLSVAAGSPAVGTAFVVAVRSSDTNTFAGLFTSGVNADGMYLTTDATMDVFDNTGALTGAWFNNGVSTRNVAAVGSFAVYSLTAATVVAPASGLVFGHDRDLLNRQWPGDIAEVIVVTRVLAASDRQKVERYLGGKYGISTS